MGGKKQPRTKNNAQPSSSERHAQRLGPGQLIGFSALSDLGYVPAAVGGATDDTTAAVSGQLRAVLKKMAKRDPITKSKAVQEFSELCDSLPLEEVTSTLPFWPRLYRKLATDPDNRVREMGQVALHRLVGRVRKAATPHMAELVPVWMCSLSDPHPPAASAARRAFQAVFPAPEKQAGVAKFCYGSILAHVSEGLYDLTPQTYSDASVLSADEVEARYTRLLTGCLWGLHELLQLLPAEEPQQQQQLSDVITNARFYKLARHPRPEVRRAWCSLVTRMCERRPLLVAGAAARLAPATVQTLSEQDPTVLTDSWNAAVCLFTTIPDVWSHVNVRKAVLPALWAALREGGRGCAVTLHPLMIVLLARLPPEVAGGEQAEFHRLFFSAMLQGLSVDRVQQSTRELSVITRSFCECALYVLRSGCSDAVVHVLVQQWSALSAEVVSGSLTRVSQHVLPPLASGLNSLYLLAGEGGCAPAAAAQRQFWQCLQEAVLRQYLTSADTTAAAVELLVSCAAPGSVPATADARPRVTFSESAPTAPVGPPAAPPSPLSTAAESPLLECAARAGQYLMDRVVAGSASPQQRRLLARLLVAVEGTAARVARRPDAGPGWTLYSCMLAPELATGGEAMVSELAATVYRLCTAEERARLTQEVTEKGYMAMVVELLQSASSSDIDLDIAAWSISDTLHSVLLNAVDTISAPNGQQQKHLLAAIQLALGLHASSGKEGDPAAALLSVAAERRWPLQPLAALCAGHCSSPAALLAAHRAALRHDCSVEALAALETRLAQFGVSTDATVANHLREMLVKGGPRQWRPRLAAATLRWARALGPARFCQQLAALLPAGWANGDRWAAQACYLLRRRSSLRPLPMVDTKARDADRLLNVPGHLRSILLGLVRADADPPGNSSCESGDSAGDATPDPDITSVVTSRPPPACGQAEIRCDAVTGCPPAEEVVAEVARYMPDLLAAQATWSAAGQLLGTPEEAWPERELVVLLDCLSQQQRLTVLQTLRMRYVQGSDGTDTAAVLLLLRLSSPAAVSQQLMPSLVQLPAERSPDIAEPPTTTDTELMLACVPMLSDSTLAALVAPPAETDRRRLALVAACVHELASRRGSDHVVAECGAAVLASLDSLVAARDDARLPACWEEVSGGWELAVESMAVLHWFEVVLQYTSCLLETPHWDLIMLGVSSWLTGVQDLVDAWLRERSAPAALLLCVLCSCMSKVQAAVELCRDAQPQLVAEWDDLYCPEWYRSLLPALTQLVARDPEGSQHGTEGDSSADAPLYSEVISAVCSVVLLAPASSLHKHDLPPLVDPDLDESHLPAETITLVSWWRRLLSSRRRCVRLVAWKTLHRYLPFLAEAEQARAPEENELDEPRLPLPALFRVVTAKTDGQVSSMLSGLPVGGRCEVDMTCPSTPGVVLTHLQTWHLAISYCGHLDTARKAMTAEALRSDGSLDRLLGQLLSLMPESPEHVPADYADTQLSYFSLPPQLSVRGVASEEEVHHWACTTYCQLLRQLPVLARRWRSGCERALTQRVDRLTSQHVSPLLLREEFARLQTADTTVDNMTVRARPSVREVCAVYTLEEAATELVVRLPADYPLGPVTADACGRRVGVATGQWRTWMLQLTTFLMHQNGSVLDGLLLWKQNMDKRFQGVEECNICFYVLHGTNYQLPKLACRNCKKRFHPACLYKWFSTSSKSTCPMCRQLF